MDEALKKEIEQGLQDGEIVWQQWYGIFIYTAHVSCGRRTSTISVKGDGKNR